MAAQHPFGTVTGSLRAHLAMAAGSSLPSGLVRSLVSGGWGNSTVTTEVERSSSPALPSLSFFSAPCIILSAS